MKLFTLTCVGLLMYLTTEASEIHIHVLVKEIQTVKVRNAINDVFLKNAFTKKATSLGKGNFIVSLNEHEPVYIHIVLNDSIITEPFFFDNKADNIEITVTDNLNLEITNSKVQDEYIDVYNPALNEINSEIKDFFTTEYRDAYIKYNGQIPDSINDRFDSIRLQLRERKFSVMGNYIMKHPDSYVAMWQLLEEVSIYGYKEKLADAFTKFSNNLKQSAIGNSIRNKLKQALLIAPGSIFPNLPVKDSGLKPIKLKEVFKGKYILVDFWYSHCAPCIEQFSALKNFYQQYNRNEFNIVSVSTDKTDDIKNWKQVITKYELPFILVIDLNGTLSRSKLSVVKFPTNYLLDANGKIIEKDITTNKLMKFLKLNL